MNELLEWCAENEVTIKFVNKAGLLAVTAKYAKLFATYTIQKPYRPDTVGRAIHAACYAVKSGAKCLERHVNSSLNGKELG